MKLHLLFLCFLFCSTCEEEPGIDAVFFLISSFLVLGLKKGGGPQLTRYDTSQ